MTESRMTTVEENQANNEDELSYLQHQNKELKDLVLKALHKRLTWDDLPNEIRDNRDVVLRVVLEGNNADRKSVV